MTSSILQGVQGGIDSQSLETILELKDIDLGNDFATSRINSNGGGSSLTNLILPQTTTRTIKTNRSHYYRGENALIAA